MIRWFARAEGIERSLQFESPRRGESWPFFLSCNARVYVCTLLWLQKVGLRSLGSSSFGDDILDTSVVVGALSLLGVDGQDVGSVSARVLDALVSSSLGGLLGLHHLINLRGLLSDLFLRETNIKKSIKQLILFIFPSAWQNSISFHLDSLDIHSFIIPMIHSFIILLTRLPLFLMSFALSFPP